MPDTVPAQPAANPDDEYWGGSTAEAATPAPADAPPRFSGGAAPDSSFGLQARRANRKAKGEDTTDDDYWGGPPAEAPVVAKKEKAEKPTWKEELVDPAIRGYEKAKQTASVLESQFPRAAKVVQGGLAAMQLPAVAPDIDTTPEQAAGTIAAAQRAMPAKPQWLTDAETQINSQDTAIGKLAAMAGNPRAFLANTIEGLTASAPTLAAASIGGPLTAIAGGAAGGYLDTYGQTVLQTLQAHGVDLSDQKAVQAALNDAPLMSQANMAAQKAGIPAAIINAASFGLAGRVYKPVAGAIGGAAGKVAGVAGEAATQGAIGAGGAELTSRVTKGEDATGGEMMGDALNQTITAAAFTAVHAGLSGKGAAKPAMAPGTPDPLVDQAAEVAKAEAAAQDMPRQATEAHNTAITVVEQKAGEAVAKAGGDDLDQTVARAHVGAVLGAHYDAARYEMYLEEGHAAAAEAENQSRLDAFVEDAKQKAEALQLESPEDEAERVPAAAEDQAEAARSAAFDQAEAAKAAKNKAPTPDEIFAKREAEEAKQKERDIIPAKNQVGDTTVAAATKGEEGYVPPTLGDNPVFQTLKERRAAAAKEAPKEPTVAERLKEQNPEDDVLPYTEPKKVAKPAAKADTEDRGPGANEQSVPILDAAGGSGAVPPTLSARRTKAAEPPKVEEPEDEDDLPGEGDSWKAKDGTGYEVLKDHGDGTYTIRTTPADSSQLPRRSKVSEATLGILKAKASEPPPEPPKTLAERRAGAGAGKAVPAAKAPRFADGSESTGLSRTDAEAALRPMLERDGTGLRVHDDPSTFPEHIQDAMADGNHPNPRGVYDPSTDTVHINASAHETPEEIQNTYVHEAAHRGLERTLGPELGDRMRDIHENASGPAKEWMQDYLDHHGKDATDPQARAEAAEEYAAHLAEKPAENPGILRKAIDAVRAGLRKVGIVKKWSDNDIRALLRETSDKRADTSTAPRFADDRPDADERAARGTEKGVQIAAGGRGSKEDFTPADPRNSVKKAYDAGANVWHNSLPHRLSTVFLRHLGDFAPKELQGPVKAYVKEVQLMTGRRNAIAERKVNIALDWEKWKHKNPEKGKALDKLMSASTIGGVDPSKPFEARYTDARKARDPLAAKHETMREGLHADLKARYDKLDGKGRALFNQVRDEYSKDHATEKEGVLKRVANSKANGNSKKELIDLLRTKFEAGKLSGPYFRLGRFGEHWASARMAPGDEPIFSRFDTRQQQQAWVDARTKEGYKEISGGQKLNDYKSAMDRIDPQFVAKVTDLLNDEGVSSNLQDEIWQLYLKSMPDISIRKQLIHRQNRFGYSDDHLRSFTDAGLHSAHQIARLEHVHKMEDHLADMETQRAAVEKNHKVGSLESIKADAVTAEFKARHDTITNPRSSPIASALTALGSQAYLGFSAGTALRIGMQNPTTAMSLLGARRSVGGAGEARNAAAYRELTKSSLQWIAALGNLVGSLKGDELAAFQEAKNRGVFTNTFSQMLSQAGRGKPLVLGKAAMANRWASKFFNIAEHLNRESTFLADFRLSREEGMDLETATQHAIDLAQDAHVDYSPENRPRILQSDAGRVVGLFKSYGMAMTYLNGRAMVDAMTHPDPATRQLAQRTYVGLTAHSLLYGGAKAVFIFAPLAFGAINLVMNHFVQGPDDPPFDAKAAAHHYFAENFGPLAADAVMNGPFSSLTRLDLSDAANVNDMLLKGPSRDMKDADWMSNAIVQAAGAVAGLPINIARGLDAIHQGDIERGIELAAPSALRNFMKGVRFASEGVVDAKGDLLIPKEELSGWSLGWQMAGVTPEKLANLYEWANTRQNIQKAVSDRHTMLQRQWNKAITSGDPQASKDASIALYHFFEANPGFVKDPVKQMSASYSSQAKARATAVAGVNTKPALQNKLDSLYGAAPE